MAADSNRVCFSPVYQTWKLSLTSHFSWIYTLYLAMDANFRLKLRNRHIKNDPELGPGWAYFLTRHITKTKWINTVTKQK